MCRVACVLCSSLCPQPSVLTGPAFPKEQDRGPRESVAVQQDSGRVLSFLSFPLSDLLLNPGPQQSRGKGKGEISEQMEPPKQKGKELMLLFCASK